MLTRYMTTTRQNKRARPQNIPLPLAVEVSLVLLVITDELEAVIP
jgi:hypothetical protein